MTREDFGARENEIQPPSLVIKTGWSQQVAEQLKQSR